MFSLILVMVCAIAAGWVANRVLVPYPIVMVLTGVALGFAYDWPTLDVDPTLVLAIVLPAVLYPAALDTSWREARQNLRPIVLLATGLVATTTLAVGIAFKWLVPATPWPVALALGAIVSPPDAVAASAVIRRLRLPRWLVTVLEGESLVNDATGLVLYRFAIVAVLTGQFSAGAMVGQFLVIAAGG
ncbi:MAG TPA: cation:proton antiporter, partial [Pseudomonadales bacterium]|nr:cation:proton antiporter [Pseudomonadales bacterium]